MPAPQQLVLSEISDSAPTALQAVKLYAKSLSGGEAVQARARIRASVVPRTVLLTRSKLPCVFRHQAEVLAAFEQLLADPAVALNPTVLLCCAQVHARAGAAPEALKLCHAVQNLELCVAAPLPGGRRAPVFARPPRPPRAHPPRPSPAWR